MPCRPTSPRTTVSAAASAADVAADEDGVAGLDALGRDTERVLQDANPGGIDKEAIALAFIHNLGIAGDDLDPGSLGGLLHGGGDFPQGLHRQPLFDDESGAEVARARAGHGEVVHRAMHRERAEVAAGKEKGAHDVGIGGEGDALAGEVEHAGVMLRFEQGVAKGGHEELADELVHELAAAAVRQQHARIVLDGKRAGGRELRRGGHGSRR